MNITIGCKRDDASLTEAYVQAPVTSLLPISLLLEDQVSLRTFFLFLETEVGDNQTIFSFCPGVGGLFGICTVEWWNSSWCKRRAHCNSSFCSDDVLWPLCIVGFLSVHFFSIAHPYLLADNRHYTFYLWRKIIHRHWSLKYLLVLPYAYSWISIISALKKSQKGLWVLAYILATCAVLVPAPLIEFRYYTLLFYFLVLPSHIENDRDWILLGLQYVFVNIFTLEIFLLRPIKWDNEPGTQRFIW
ncbi:hypothetical protein MLD38_016073 [Melastoma candidum]|nr:hypothetical protein MLD38_016073 [Melastoma candidum]